MTFDDLGLAQPILRAVREEGYEVPTPIQQQAIPAVLRVATCSPAHRPAPARPPASPCRCCSG
jgi:superfamily II DNA/RNA helicase